MSLIPSLLSLNEKTRGNQDMTVTGGLLFPSGHPFQRCLLELKQKMERQTNSLEIKQRRKGQAGKEIALRSTFLSVEPAIPWHRNVNRAAGNVEKKKMMCCRVKNKKECSTTCFDSLSFLSLALTPRIQISDIWFIPIFI